MPDPATTPPPGPRRGAPLTAYQIYTAERFAVPRPALPIVTSRDLCAQFGDEWTSLGPAGQAPYRDEAAALAEEGQELDERRPLLKKAKPM